MDPFPSQILKYLLKRTLRDHSVAYLRLLPDLTLQQSGGWTAHYGLDAIDTRRPLQEQLPMLVGLMPMEQERLILPAVETAAGIPADIHLIRDEGGYWVVFLDARPETDIRKQMQQKSNELSLLREKHDKILDQYLGKLVVTSLEQGWLKIKEEGERREVTILFADIRDFTSFSEKNPPGRVFFVLNRYLDAMIRPVIQEGGYIDNIIGDSIMAIFGIFPTILSPQSHAVIAARDMIEGLARLNQSTQFAGHSHLQVSVGIATGPVAVGILGSKERRTFSAIGHTVNLASRLEGLARHNEIVIDKSSYNRIGDYRNYFARSTYSFKGINDPVQIYSWHIK